VVQSTVTVVTGALVHVCDLQTPTSLTLVTIRVKCADESRSFSTRSITCSESEVC